MSSSESDPFEYDHDLETPHANQPNCQLEASRVVHDDRPDEYAITPVDLESGIVTTWIAVEADDVLDLDDYR